MKVLEVDSRGGNGRIIRNPVSLPKILKNSSRGAANGLLTHDTLIISTIPCSSHEELAKAAGIEIVEYKINDFDVGGRVAKLQLSDDGFGAEIWCDEFWTEENPDSYNHCPVSEDQLQALSDWMRSHPKIKAAYGSVTPTVEVYLMDSWAQAVRIFKDGKLSTPEDVQVPEQQDEDNQLPGWRPGL